MTSLALPLPSKQRELFADCALTLGINLWIILFAQLSLYLPFSPIPIVLSNSLILLLSAHLEKRFIVAAVSLYLIEGALGAPVFAGGAGGIATLMGPKGGYLIGYLAASWVTATWRERGGRLAPSLALGTLALYLFGWSYLSLFVGFERGFLLGVAPFLVGDFLKLAIGVGLFAPLRRV